MIDALYTTREVADELGVTPATVHQWVHRGYLTPVGKKGRQNVYRLADVFEAERCNRWRSPLLVEALDPGNRAAAQDRLTRILAAEPASLHGGRCEARQTAESTCDRDRPCSRPAVKDAPVPLCVSHLAAAYLHVRDVLEAARMSTAAGSTDQSVVYFIQRGDCIKIGYTADLKTRLRALKGDRVLLALPGSRAHESALHELFKAHRLEGEWFRMAPEIMEFINEHAEASTAA